MKDLFIGFLKEQNAYDDFVANFSEEDGIESYLDELSGDSEHYITDAFIWGSDYIWWSKLNRDWLDFLDKQNEKNN